MKVLLTTLNSKYIHSALSLQYLYNYCKEDFNDIKIVEYTINHNRDYILAEIYKGNYDIICFSCYIWNITHILEIVNELKKVCPDSLIVLGGPEVSFDPEYLMQNHLAIDYIVVGEGEITFKELLEYLTYGTIELLNIDGLVYQLKGIVIRNKDRMLIEDLKIIPSPYAQSLESYENKILYYESSRGCPHNCKYCLSSTIKGVRFFPVSRVKKDMDRYLQHRVKQVKFVDRTFNSKKSHCLEIMKYLVQEDNGFTNFHFEITADLLDEEILVFLSTVREGIFQFEVGVQTTYEQTMKSIDRSVDFSILSETIRRIASFRNIHLHLDLIAGLPYETYERFKTSIDDVYRLKPEKLQLGFLKLLKGSAIRQEMDTHKYVFQDRPPYEVMANKNLGYSEVLKLKIIEEMMEIYYNSNAFNHTIDYTVTNFFGRPSEFYEALASYWEDNGYHHLSHGKNELYEILLGFLKVVVRDSYDVHYDLLKYDYLLQRKSSLPDFLRDTPEVIDLNRAHQFLQKPENILRYLPKYEGVPAKQIIKRVHFENFRFDIFKLNLSNMNEGIHKTTILFDYDLDNKTFTKSKAYSVEI